jgi:putative transposase/transposase-like zinc-binding protein
MLQASCHPAPGARPQPHCEVADIVRRYGPAYRSAHPLPLAHLKVLQAIESCRTAARGGHRECCAACGFERYAYNSCRNRHCPKCQSLAKEQWLEARQAELLPVPYFHNVFTLPHQLNALILCHQQNQRAILNLLFQATAQTLLPFGRTNLGGTLGATLVLHTWDQQVRPHFHRHCVIPGGVLSFDRDQWRPAHPRFLFPVRALSKVFRGKFLDGLRQLYDTQQLLRPATVNAVSPLADPARFYEWLSALRHQPWVVYAQAPFAGPEKLLTYLGHYTHRVAIRNARLLSCADGQVVFHYRDRTAGDIRKTMTLPADEFLRRFLCHVLPSGFQRIRHYGLLASRTKHDDLARCRQLLGTPTPPPPVKKTTAEWILLLLGIDVDRCPRCGKKGLQRTTLVPPQLARPRTLRALPTPPPEDDSS